MHKQNFVSHGSSDTYPHSLREEALHFIDCFIEMREALMILSAMLILCC